MNVDVLIESRHADWELLRSYSRRRTFTAEQANNFYTLYRAACTDLAWLRSRCPDDDIIDALAGIVLAARTTLTRSAAPGPAAIAEFFTVSLPYALWRLRYASLAVSAAAVTIGVLVAAWVAGDPAGFRGLVDPADATLLVKQDFEEYYHQGTPATFGAKLWTNNGFIAAILVASGITGIWPLFTLWQNAVTIGATAGIMHGAGGAATFWSLIVPHGLLELNCVFVAGAAGLSLAWAWMRAGTHSRWRRLAREGRTTMTVAAGLVIFLGLSAVVEAFVTPAPWPTALRVALGIIAWLSFLGYAGYFGRKAEKAGLTGDVAHHLTGDHEIAQG